MKIMIKLQKKSVGQSCIVVDGYHKVNYVNQPTRDKLSPFPPFYTLFQLFYGLVLLLFWTRKRVPSGHERSFS